MIPAQRYINRKTCSFLSTTARKNHLLVGTAVTTRSIFGQNEGFPTKSQRRPYSTEKFVFGSHKWARMTPDDYTALVQHAVSRDITILEAGQDGGAHVLADALQSVHKPVTVVERVGYRTVLPEGILTQDASSSNNNNRLIFPNDVLVEEHPFQKGPKSEEEPEKGNIQIIHSFSPEYVRHALRTSPLQDVKTAKRIAMLHNPETQGERATQAMKDAFLSLEEQVNEGILTSYGVVSNGLCLPTGHPLHLPLSSVLEAAEKVKGEVGKLHLSTIQLPINLLETDGIEVSKRIKDAGEYEVWAMRPLTCYPDRGAGTGKPFILADYLIPDEGWTHEMHDHPAQYEAALKTAMSHFDAEKIITKKQAGETLTTEERETLDGCKLLQSLLHDVDVKLDKMRSFAAHEDEVYQKIIPLIHDTFEGYDEETATVLGNFFASYSLAVRYYIARNTRKLLKEGENGDGGTPKYPDIPDDVKLQKYAMDFLLREESIDKLVVGWTRPDQIEEDLMAV